MRVSELGEKKLVEIAQECFSDNRSGENIAVGIGDDAAAVRVGNELLLISSDITHADTHFPPGSPPRLCGWYAAAVNLSDLASKGGRPLGILLDIGLPHDFPLSWFREVLRGFNECCKHYRTPVSGGDTKFSSDLLMAPTVIGRIESSRFIPRKGCKPGDVVCITGTIGGSYGAYMKISDYLSINEERHENQRRKYSYVDERTVEYRYYEKMLKVHPHLEAGRILSKSGVVTCGMDISDGLAMSLHELARVNKCGFEISEEALSIDPLIEKIGCSAGQSLDIGLYRGGDFGLLFTVKRERIEIAEKLFHDNGHLPPLFIIGRVTDEDHIMKGRTSNLSNDNVRILLKKGGVVKAVENRGWEHLRG